MKTLKMTHPMKSLIELRRRKAALKTEIQVQQEEMKATFQDLKQSIEPSVLLRKVVSGALGFSDETPLGTKKNSWVSVVQWAIPFLISSKKWGFVLRILMPLLARIFPSEPSVQDESAAVNTAPEKPTAPPLKVQLLHRLREEVGALRQHIKPAPSTDLKEPKA